jgi:hypothetical protein
VTDPTGGVPLVQSPLILNAEFQTAKNRLLKNLELSDHGGFSQQRDDDVQGLEERLSTIKPWKSYSMYEREETTSYGVLPDTLRRNQNRIG